MDTPRANDKKDQTMTPTPPQEQTEREAFEAWASDGGKWPQAIERYGNGLYRLSSTHSYWLAWQARASMQAQAPEVAALQRAMRVADIAAEELVCSEGHFPGRHREYVFEHGAVDEHLLDCIEHLCWRGLATRRDDASEIVLVLASKAEVPND
jgi:hypothetical protein